MVNLDYFPRPNQLFEWLLMKRLTGVIDPKLIPEQIKSGGEQRTAYPKVVPLHRDSSISSPTIEHPVRTPLLWSWGSCVSGALGVLLKPKNAVVHIPTRTWQADRKLNIAWGSFSIEHSNFRRYLGVTVDVPNVQQELQHGAEDARPLFFGFYND